MIKKFIAVYAFLCLNSMALHAEIISFSVRNATDSAITLIAQATVTLIFKETQEKNVFWIAKNIAPCIQPGASHVICVECELKIKSDNKYDKTQSFQKDQLVYVYADDKLIQTINLTDGNRYTITQPNPYVRIRY